MNKKIIQEQFGAHAAYYETSKIHAQGVSLTRLLQLIEPKSDWKVLDLATAAGHTALYFAPHVAHVWATDITPEMLETAKRRTEELGLKNVTVEYADAEDLPYEPASFDLVTCRIAPHHFPDIHRFIKEAIRVLRPGGVFAVVDNVVPPGQAGDYINAFEKLRDPTHVRCLSIEEWLKAFESLDLILSHHETITKQINFEEWAARHGTQSINFLRAMLMLAPPGARSFLQPQTTQGHTTFRLREGILIGRLRN